MAGLQTIQDYERWEERGRPFKPEGFDKIDDAWKAEDGAYVGVTVHGQLRLHTVQSCRNELCRNRHSISSSPEFKGKIITTFPDVHDVTLYLYQTLVYKYGPEFLDKLKANQPVFVRGHLGVSRAIAFRRRENADVRLRGEHVDCRRQVRQADCHCHAGDRSITGVCANRGPCSRTRRIPMRPSSTSVGTYSRNSKAARAPAYRAPTWRRRRH